VGGVDPILHVSSSGRVPGPDIETFVLLHGFGASSFTWRHWLPELERRGHVLAVDLLGFGGSPKPEDGPYDPVGQAGLVMDALQAVGASRVTLVGHSFGGGVAILTALGLQAAGDAPSRLVMVAGAAYEQRLPPFVRCARYPRIVGLAFRAVGPRFVVRQVARPIVYDFASITNDFVEGHAEPLTRPGAIRALLTCAARIAPPDLDAITARYASLAMPTLLLWGRHDRVVPPSVGSRLARTLPNARFHLLERCGHIPQEEVPDASLRLLERFLDASRFHA
jgi:pimeloyl-ACP methyl ester carboxylesterase